MQAHLRFAALAVARTAVERIGLVACLLASFIPPLSAQVLQSSSASIDVERLRFARSTRSSRTSHSCWMVTSTRGSGPSNPPIGR